MRAVGMFGEGACMTEEHACAYRHGHGVCLAAFARGGHDITDARNEARPTVGTREYLG